MNTQDHFYQAAQSAAIKAASMSPPEALAHSLTNEQPKIESAVKSFMSICAAKSLTASETDKTGINTAISSISLLKCARSLLKCINNITLPVDDDGLDVDDDGKNESEGKLNYEEQMTAKLERDVVRIVWNGLIQAGKKPCTYLGRTSLRYVYPLISKELRERKKIDGSKEGDISASIIVPEGIEPGVLFWFFEEFGRLLVESNTLKDAKDEADYDSHLLWAADGGQSELARRRERRENKAAKRQQVSDPHKLIADNISGLLGQSTTNNDD